MESIVPFEIAVADSALLDLQRRLTSSRFPDEITEAGWDLGTPLAEAKRLVAYWRDEFDWKKVESALNKALPDHYWTKIPVKSFGSIGVHFIHRKSQVDGAIPLIFVHGWPGSFLEATKLLNRLSGDGMNEPAFDVVVISLPNFAFSEGITQQGFAIEHYAEVCHNLMLKLGYSEYVTQAGDWGFFITRAMSLLYPAHLKAAHLNFDFASGPPSWQQYPLLALEHAFRPYNEREKKGLARMQWFNEQSSGYFSLQSTKPQTLSYALTDSPVALLCWLWEKLHDWTDDYPWTDEEICTWVSVYWFSTAGPGAAHRIHYEGIHEWKHTQAKITRARAGEWIGGVPIGYSHQPRENRMIPSTWTRKLGRIVFERWNDRGGHFFAYECPDLLVRDVRDMFRIGSGAYGVVSGRSGYSAG